MSDKVIALIISVIFLIIYILTIAPTVTFEDSGELISGAVSLGIPHPPGYPLYCLLGKLFSFIPAGNPSFKINLLSSFTSSAAIFFLYLLLRTFRLSKIISCMSTALFGLSSTFWTISTTAEVYSLHILLVILLFYVLINRDKIRYPLELFAFLFSISLANHHTVLFLSPVFLIIIIKDYNWTPHLATMVLLIILGLSLYMYLPIRASANPAINWGNPSINWKSTSPFKRLFDVILRKQYGTISTEKRSLIKYIKQLSAINPMYEYINTGTPNLFQKKFNVIQFIFLIFIIFSIFYSGYIINTKFININILSFISSFFVFSIVYFLFNEIDLFTSILKIFFSLVFLISIIYYLYIKTNTLNTVILSLILIFGFWQVLIMNTPLDKLFTLKVFFLPVWLAVSVSTIISIEGLIRKALSFKG